MRGLPRGRVWPARDNLNCVQAQTLAPLMDTYSRLAARDAHLLVDAFPQTAYELLPEWEYTLGLPDPCAGTSPTLQQRQQQVVARLTARGGQSIDYFINFAASLGYPITITQFAPFRVGQTVGQSLNGEAWAFAWQINAPTFTVEQFRVGRDTVGEPLANWGNTVLQCEMNRLKPAQTTLLFSYR